MVLAIRLSTDLISLEIIDWITMTAHTQRVVLDDLEIGRIAGDIFTYLTHHLTDKGHCVAMATCKYFHDMELNLHNACQEMLNRLTDELTYLLKISITDVLTAIDRLELFIFDQIKMHVPSLEDGLEAYSAIVNIDDFTTYIDVTIEDVTDHDISPWTA